MLKLYLFGAITSIAKTTSDIIAISWRIMFNEFLIFNLNDITRHSAVILMAL